MSAALPRTAPESDATPAITASDRAHPEASALLRLVRWFFYRPDHVVAALSGGLGNQLFQFAVARALSLRLGVPLKLDYGDKTDYWGRRGCELGFFNLPHARLSDAERACWLGLDATPWTQRRAFRWLDRALLRRRRVEEKEHAWNDLLRLLNQPLFLVGGWQSEIFFREQRDAIRAELLARADCSAASPFYAELSAPGAVAVHIRRGDYLSPGVNQIMGQCSIDYYERAFAHVRTQVNAPRFYFFTDDPDWVRAEPRLASVGKIIPPDRAEPARDLLLMARCEHFVTANSSFSWWAAWLGQRANSIVVCPEPWFDSAPAAQAKIIPAAWASLPKK